MIRLACGDLSAEVSPLGAELQALSWRGRELLWDGDPAWWGRRAPVLFPIVGRLAGDTLRLGGRTFRMTQHGFARDLPWEILESGPRLARLRLQDSGITRGSYPFAFRLEQRVGLDEAGLRITLTLTNPGEVPLPASLGLHPAFRWPLPGGRREDHEVWFDHPEPSPVRRLRNGLLAPEAEPSPVAGQRLTLDDALFARDALIFDAPASRGLVYRGGDLALRLAWDFPHIAIWTRPGAPFLCLEPWQGHADPEGFQGDFLDKPGLAILSPGTARSWSLSIAAGESLS